MSSYPDLDYRKMALVHNENISVLAGAGSGKTHTLVQRYLDILLSDPENIRRLAAITFTRKAAGEMQERIFREISKRLAVVKESAERLTLLQIRDQLKSAQISTIHEFCSKILREFPLQAGLSPDFAVMEELQRQIILQEVLNGLEEKIPAIEKTSPRAGDWMNLLIAIGRGKLEKILKEILTHPEVSESFYSRFKNLPLAEYIEYLWALWLDKKEQIWPGLNPDVLSTEVGDLLAGSPPLAENEKAQQVWQVLKDYQVSCTQPLQPRQVWIKFLALTAMMTTDKGKAYANLAWLGAAKSWSNTAKDKLIILSERCSGYRLPWLENKGFATPGPQDEDFYHALQMILEIAAVLSQEFEQIKSREGLLDFDDLQLKTRNLLRQFSEVRMELRHRYRYLMVDEFQDTNKLQWEIVHLLSYETDKDNPDKKIFVVGDPKQSIYGFRNADVRVFNEVRRLFETAGGESYQGSVNFGENFRFLPELNAFINYIFSRILRPVKGVPYTVGYDALRAMRSKTGFSRISVTVAKNELETEEQLITRAIQKLMTDATPITLPSAPDGSETVRSIEYGDIAILIRSRTRLLSLEQALQKTGIPFRTIGGVGFWQRQEIFDLYHLLRFIQSPTDDLSLIALLRSRFFAVSDQDLLGFSQVEGTYYIQKLMNLPGLFFPPGRGLAAARDVIERWLNRRDHVPLDELLRVIFEDTGIRAILASEINGEQLSANLLKLQDLAASYAQKPGGGLAVFLGQMEELITNEMAEGEPAVELEDRHTVKILTIHNSKGLEFPVVFVPYLTRQEKESTDSVLSDADYGFTFRLKDALGDSVSNLFYDYVNQAGQARDLAEARRVLYVALTRAQNILWLSGDISRRHINNRQPLQWLWDVLNLTDEDLKKSRDVDYGEFRVQVNPQLPEPIHIEASEDWFEKRAGEILQAMDKLPLVPVEPPTGGMEIQTFSPTRLMVYRENRGEYFRRYHLGFFESDYDLIGQDVKKNEPVLLLGKLLHQLLERPERIEREQSTGYENLLARHEIHQIEAREYLRSQLNDLIASAGASERLQNILSAAESKTEVVLTMKLTGHYFTGTIDRLWRDENGQWRVIDYKTNRLRGASAESIMSGYELQAQSYALLLSALYPDQDSYAVQFAFIREDQWAERIYGAGDIARIREEFSALILQIVNEDWAEV